jgi:hypothetical protein
VTAAGWNHKYFIRTMFGAAGILALTAIFWRRIQPVISANNSDWLIWLSKNQISWLVMFAVCMVAVLGVARLRGLGSSAPGKIGDIECPATDVRFAPESRHRSAQARCRLCAKET